MRSTATLASRTRAGLTHKLIFPSTDPGINWHAEPAGYGYLHPVNQKTNQVMNVARASTGALLIE
jgi:hypothetical protein